MPHLTTDDSVKLFYEETGAGAPIIFVHEFAGDSRSWEAQVRHFGRRYRCITYNARGYPPSDVPDDPEKYSQARARDDIKAVLDALGMAKAAATYALGPARVQLQNKDPRGWQEFADQFAQHSARGAALTMRGVQNRRPSLYDLTDAMAALKVPTLIMTGDEDWPCLEPALLMKRMIASAALVVLPNSGHA